MTSRELLRAVADYLDDQMVMGNSARGAALRALAGRIDDEMQFADKMRYRSIEAYGAWDCLSRIDTDTSPSPRVATDATHKNRQG